MKPVSTVENYIERQGRWKDPLLKLRKILLATELKETIKWGQPVYVLDRKNVLGMSAFKSYVGIWFYQGVFFSDPLKMLVNAFSLNHPSLKCLDFVHCPVTNNSLSFVRTLQL